MRPMLGVTRLLLAAVALLGARAARADSIWAKAQGTAGQRRVRVYEDDTARQVGDSHSVDCGTRSARALR